MPMIPQPRLQVPNIPQPQVQMGGVSAQAHIPQPAIPQLSIPQPTIPQASVNLKGSAMLERIIIFLVGLLLGVGLGLLLKK